jgi:thioesterase domain-containing protein
MYTILTINGRPLSKYFENAYAVNWFAASRYEPRPYPGSITLFRALSRATTNARESQDDLDWKSLASGGLEVHEFAGTHHNILREPNVQLLAQKITACLNLHYRRQHVRDVS